MNSELIALGEGGIARRGMLLGEEGRVQQTNPTLAAVSTLVLSDPAMNNAVGLQRPPLN